MIEFVIFDFDGVLENNYELHYQLSKKKIVDITREEHRKLFEGNIHVERAKLSHRDTGFDLMSHFSESKKNAIMEPSAKKVLLALSEKYKLGIITSANEYGINNYLINNNIKELFSFVYGFETDKIKVKKFEKVFDVFGTEPRECVFVTDTLGDIYEANKVGVKSIALDSGFHERERLRKGNPVGMISNLEELCSVVREVEY